MANRWASQKGMDNVRRLHSYGDMPPWGKGPQQGPIRNQGARYIEENFPKLDKFETCTVTRVEDPRTNVKQQEGGVAVRGALANEHVNLEDLNLDAQEAVYGGEQQFSIISQLIVLGFVGSCFGLCFLLNKLLARRKNKQTDRTRVV